MFVRSDLIFINKDTRGTTDCRKNRLKESYLLACQFYYTYESFIFMGKLEQNWIVVP